MMFKLTDVLINNDVEKIESLMDMGVIPDLRIDQGTPSHDKNLFDHTLHVVQNVPANPVMKIAALFHDCGKPSTKEWNEEKGKFTYYDHDKVGAEITMHYMGMLGINYRDASAITTLVYYHMRPLHYFNQPFKAKGLRRLVRNVEANGATMDQLLSLNRADILAHSKRVIDRNLPLHHDLRQKIDDVLAVA